MLINPDNAMRTLVHARDLPWVASPRAGASGAFGNANSVCPKRTAAGLLA